MSLAFLFGVLFFLGVLGTHPCLSWKLLEERCSCSLFCGGLFGGLIFWGYSPLLLLEERCSCSLICGVFLFRTFLIGEKSIWRCFVRRYYSFLLGVFYLHFKGVRIELCKSAMMVGTECIHVVWFCRRLCLSVYGPMNTVGVTFL